MTNGVQLLTSFSPQNNNNSTVIQQPYTIHMNSAAYVKSAFAGRNPASSSSSSKTSKEALLEKAHREYQLGDYVNAEIHCKQVRLLKIKI